MCRAPVSPATQGGWPLWDSMEPPGLREQRAAGMCSLEMPPDGFSLWSCAVSPLVQGAQGGSQAVTGADQLCSALWGLVAWRGVPWGHFQTGLG